LGQKVKCGRLLLSKWERMAEKAAITFVTALVQFLVLRNSKLPFSKPFGCLQSQSYFTTDGLSSISSSWRQASWASRSTFLLTEHLLT
jgi:hypothetical protein